MGLLLLPLALVCASCCKTQVPAHGLPGEQVFTFNSGGAGHIQGHGAWNVELSASGMMWLRHDVRDDSTDHGAHRLPPAESSALWKLIEAIDVTALETSTRPGVPDEVQYTFQLRGGDADHSAEIWANDADDSPAIEALINKLRILIERYAGTKPVI